METTLCVWFSFVFTLIFCVGCEKENGDRSDLSVVGSALHDFGEHHQQELLNHIFTLKNNSAEQIKIAGFKTSCTCLVAGNDKLGTTTLAPDDTFEVPISFKTGSAQTKAAGRIMVYYHVVKDPDALKKIVLNIQAKVLPDYRITPREVDFGIVDGLAKKSLRQVVTVAPESAADTAIEEVSSSVDFISAQLLPEKNKKGAFQIEVSLDISKFKTSQPFNGSVVISTNSKRQPKSIVRIQGKYDSLASAEPNMLVISSDKTGMLERVIQVTTSLPSRIKALTCSADEDQIRVEYPKDQKSLNHQLKLTLARSTENALDCEIELELELFTEQETRVVRRLAIPVHRFLEKID